MNNSTKVFTYRSALILIGLGLFALACQSPVSKNQYQSRNENLPLVDDKYSLRADREALSEVRKDIPEQTIRANDERAFFLDLFSDVKKNPTSIREKFDNFVRKKRELFQKDAQKERENFTQSERKERDLFLKRLAKNRADFMSQKSDKNSRDDFFKEQDGQRKEFFTNEKEKRQDFESDLRERRKNFEDYIREKQGEFNQELKIHRQKYDEFEKQKKKKNSDQLQLEKDLQEFKNNPGVQIESGE